MAAIGQPFDDSVPAVGTSGTAYASTINAILQECIDRLSTSIPTGSIAAATTSLDLNNNALTNVSYVGLYDQSVTPSGAPFGRLAAYDGDLYWVGTSGVIQLTSGAAINIAGVAGIGGDYGGSDPALVSFDGATETYRFWDDSTVSPETWAIVKARELGLIDEGTTFTVNIKASASTAASYTLTLPVNDPAAGTAILSLNSSGVLATGSTISTDETFSGTVTFSSDPVLSGTTNIRHGERTLQVGLAATAFGPGPVAVSVVPTTVSGILVAPVNDTTINIPLTVQQGWRLKSVRVTGNKGTADTATLGFRHKATGSAVTVLGSNTSTTNGNYDFSVTGLTHSVLASNKYFVTLNLPISGDTLEVLELVYDVVA